MFKINYVGKQICLKNFDNDETKNDYFYIAKDRTADGHKIYSKMVLAGIIIGFSTQMYFVYLHFTNQNEKANQIAAKISKQPW